MSTVDFSTSEWRTSSFSGGGGGGNCVEIAVASGVVGVRDSKNPGPCLVFARDAFALVWRREAR